MPARTSRRRLLLLVLAGAALSVVGFAAPTAEAKTYYLKDWNGGGRDSASRSGSASQPFFSIEYALTRMDRGDDIRMYGGQYDYNSPQRINKSGYSNNRIDIRPVANTGEVILDAWGHAIRDDDGYHEPTIVVEKDNITVQGLTVRKNRRGGGINVWGDNVTIKDCRVYENGDYAIGTAGNRGEGASWSDLPDNVLIEGCVAYRNCRINDPSYPWFKEVYRANEGGWPGAINAFGVRNVRIRGCTSYENFGEGIFIARSRGGDSEISNCTVRDNWSVNIYLDSAQGTQSNWIQVFDNTISGQWKQEFEKGGNPAAGIVVSSESYDDGLSNQKSEYVSVYDNNVQNCWHNYWVSNFGGLGVTEVWFGGNKSGWAEPGPEVKIGENGSTITKIWTDYTNTRSNGTTW